MRGLILFDLDGTLMDSAPGLAHSANFLRTRAGLAPLPYEALREHCGRGAAGLIWAGLRMPTDAVAFGAAKRDFLAHYAQIMVQDSTLFEGVAEMLSQLRQTGFDWGIVTNKAIELARPLCEAKGIAKNAACILSGQSFAAAKPAPDALLHAMETLGYAACETIYVGDDARDAQALPLPGATPAAERPFPTGVRPRWPDRFQNFPNWPPDCCHAKHALPHLFCRRYQRQGASVPRGGREERPPVRNRDRARRQAFSFRFP